MKVLSLALVVCLAAPAAAKAGQGGRSAAPAQPADPVAEAYSQFLLGHRLEDEDNIDGAIAAYKRAMTLDPQAAEIVAELADLYMRQNRMQEALTTAEQALKVSESNRQAHRVLGTIYATLATSGTQQGQRPTREAYRENAEKAIQHLERAIEGPIGRADANVRAMLARLYVGSANYDKAIPLLSDLVKQEPQWRDGASLLVEAYSAAGRGEDALRWLEDAVQADPELYPTLADFYARERRWRDAANAYEQAIAVSPRSADLKSRYGQMLLLTGVKEDIVKARTALREALAIRGNDENALYFLSQAERRTGELDAAESTA